MEQQKVTLTQEHYSLYQERNNLQKSLHDVEREMRDLQDKEMEDVLKPLQEELTKKREPILKELQELEMSEQEIWKNYRDWKANLKRAWDKIDDQDIRFRFKSVEKRRKELFASVDGDCPERIEQTRRTIIDQFRERKKTREQEINEAMEALSIKITEKNEAISRIDQEIQAIWAAKGDAILNAFGNGEGIEQLIPEIEQMMIAEMRIG